MSQISREIKVGLFALICLALLASLVLAFNKGGDWFEKSYPVQLRVRDVGGVQKNAPVMMAGVRVGRVGETHLAEDGRTVLMTLHLLERHAVHQKDRFTIEQAGFLGDKFVSIIPGEHRGQRLAAGDEVEGQAPFNLEAAARAGLDLIANVDRTVSNLNTVVVRVNDQVLTETNVEHVNRTLANFRLVSDQTLGTVANVHGLVTNNAPDIRQTVTNLVIFTEHLQSVTNLAVFSSRLNELAEELQVTVISNRQDFTAAMDNIRASSASLRGILDGLDSGQGLAGGLLKDPRLRLQTDLILSNMTVLSSNLNRFGLLYKPKKGKTRPAPLPNALHKF